jgi:hypothetical protein
MSDTEKDWRILAYLKNATVELSKKIEETDDREELINSVMKLRQVKRVELTCRELMKKNL